MYHVHLSGVTSRSLLRPGGPLWVLTYVGCVRFTHAYSHGGRDRGAGEGERQTSRVRFPYFLRACIGHSEERFSWRICALFLRYRVEAEPPVIGVFDPSNTSRGLFLILCSIRCEYSQARRYTGFILARSKLISTR